MRWRHVIDDPRDPDYEEPTTGPQEGVDGYPNDFADMVNGYVDEKGEER